MTVWVTMGLNDGSFYSDRFRSISLVRESSTRPSSFEERDILRCETHGEMVPPAC